MLQSFFFSHDYNTRTNAKIKKLLLKHGYAGYGIFWAIIEDLYNNANALPTDCESIAYDLRTDVEVVKSILYDFDFFVFEGASFSSPSVQKRLDARTEKSEKARKSVEKRWKAQGKDTNVFPTQNDRNTIKESTGKESTQNESTGKESTEKEIPDTKKPAVAVDPPVDVKSQTEAQKNNQKPLAPSSPPLLNFKEVNQSLHSPCMELYANWFQKFSGSGAKIDAVQGKAMHQLIDYLGHEVLKKNLAQTPLGEDEYRQKVQDCFEYIFNNWHKLDGFLGQKTKLVEINSNIQNIIVQIKNSTQKNGNKLSFTKPPWRK